MFKCIGLKRSRNYGRYTLNKLWISIDYLQIFTKQYNISYRGQRFQQSTKFVWSVSIIEYNLRIKPIYQYNTYYS
jgi:hypothetical protein